MWSLASTGGRAPSRFEKASGSVQPRSYGFVEQVDAARREGEGDDVTLADGRTSPERGCDGRRSDLSEHLQVGTLRLDHVHPIPTGTLRNIYRIGGRC
ncbi:hypothetical protein [Mangrovibrevibacter kandeliae]|uniref:hypothetical protein n=1 Tax=Mangrovibrevibacter kandeliae TaxID=2968473 RepID=UPI00211747C6|nr:hypothetical protein [Aurantimonas sp. CSK15Z-1]MCQ8780655.1 hypothetical protein [Aurantimonas sp. CSK15Z-1]